MGVLRVTRVLVHHTLSTAEPETKKLVEHQEIFARDLTYLHHGPHHVLHAPHLELQQPHGLHHPNKPLPHHFNQKVLVLVHHLESPKLGIYESECTHWACRDTHLK